MNAKVAALVVAIVAVVALAAWMLLGGGTGSPGRANRDRDREAAAPDDAVGDAGPAGAFGANRSGAAASRGAAPARILPRPPASGESTIVGTVVEAGTRAPVSQAEIVLRHPQAEFAVVATSQADGKFVLDRVPGVVGARVFVSATGFGPRLLRDVHVPPHDRLDLGTIELDRGVPIQGLVVTALGAPIAGAQVDLIESSAAAPGSYTFNLVSAFRDLRKDDEALDQVLTAADGAFSFPGVAPGKYVLAASKPGWQVRYSRAFSIEPGMAPAGLTLRLVEGRAIRGLVKDEAGAPVAGAAVAALEVDPQNIFVVKSQKASTASDGRFAYACFGAGDVAVIVSAPGYSGTSKANIKAGGPEIELVLRKSARIEGRVYDRATGKGLPDAVVVAMQLGMSISLEETRSGPDGAYAIEAGPTGQKVAVFAKLPGYAMALRVDAPSSEHESPWAAMLEREEVPAGGTFRRDLPMVAGGALSGRVVDDSSGQGIGGADVVLHPTGGLEFLGCTDPSVTRTDADGSFSFPSIGAGKVTVRADASGYTAPEDIPVASVADPPDGPEPARPAIAVITPGGAETGVVIRLRRGVDVDVLVTDPGGTPMPGASVSWVMPREELGNAFGPAKRPRAVPTDDGGRVRLKGVARMAGIVIAARHQAFPAGSDVTIDATTPPREPVKIVLAAGASLAGVVLDVDGKPAADRDVVYRPSHADVGRAFGEWSWQSQHVTTDAAGKFLVENLPTGEGKLEVWEKRAPNEAGASHNREREDCLPPEDAKIVLVAGKREDVRLQLVRTLDIRGRVFDAAGKPLAGVWVTANLANWSSDASAVTGADGTYRMGGLSPGDYEVAVNGPQQSPEIPPEVLKRTVVAGSRDVDFRFTK